MFGFDEKIEEEKKATPSLYLNNLPFTDLYIRLDKEGSPSRFRPDITRVPKKLQRNANLEVPWKYNGHMNEIRSAINSDEKRQGVLTYEDLRLRFVKISSEGELWASIRANPLNIPDFYSLGHAKELSDEITKLTDAKGLILLGGKTGQGKTTTCVSLLKKYLDTAGGMLFTIEDPPEYALQGTHGESGFALQWEVENDDWATAAQAAMRSRPDYIMFGEIRSPEAAESLLKTLTSGHLVVATIHAGSVSDAVTALMQLAQHKLGRVARDSLADRLLAAIYQEMTPQGPMAKSVMPSLESNNEQRRAIMNIIKSDDASALDKNVKAYQPQKALDSRRERSS